MGNDPWVVARKKNWGEEEGDGRVLIGLWLVDGWDYKVT